MGMAIRPKSWLNTRSQPNLRVAIGFFMLTLLANRARATSLHIDRVDPIPQKCGSFTFRWTGGTAPYTLSIREINQTTLREPSLGNQHEESYVWDPVDVQGGTSLYAEVLDSTGQRDATAAFQIQESSDSGCLALISSASSTSPSTVAAATATTSSSTQGPTTNTPSPTPSSPAPLSESPTKRLSTGAIAGIVAGLVVVALLAVVLVFINVRRASLSSRARRWSPIAGPPSTPRTSICQWGIGRRRRHSSSALFSGTLSSDSGSGDVHGGHRGGDSEAEDARVRCNSSLIVHTSYPESDDMHNNGRTQGLVMSQKILREMKRAQASAASREGDTASEKDVDATVMASPPSHGRGLDSGRGPGTREVIAGEPESTARGMNESDWQTRTTSDSTLPPPYESC